jgi:hypothetical protein
MKRVIPVYCLSSKTIDSPSFPVFTCLDLPVRAHTEGCSEVKILFNLLCSAFDKFPVPTIYLSNIYSLGLNCPIQ